MIFNVENSAGATVYDIDGKGKIDRVLMINTMTGAVVVAKQPLQLNHKGSIDRETIRFETIRPIYGGGTKPCLFHCYGRQA